MKDPKFYKFTYSRVDNNINEFKIHVKQKIRQSTIYYAGLLGRWDKGIVD